MKPVVARLRGHDEISVGTVLGSNVFNALLIVGVTAAITPITVTGNEFGFAVAAGVATMLLAIPRADNRIPTVRGVLLLAAYAGYLAVLIATQWRRQVRGCVDRSAGFSCFAHGERARQILNQLGHSAPVLPSAASEEPVSLERRADTVLISGRRHLMRGGPDHRRGIAHSDAPPDLYATDGSRGPDSPHPPILGHSSTASPVPAKHRGLQRVTNHTPERQIGGRGGHRRPRRTFDHPR